jgi:hypothetical protein
MTTTAEAQDSQPRLPFPLQADERVLKVCRRHWIYLWPLLIVQILVAIVPVAVAWWGFDEIGALDGTGGTIFAIIAIVWLVYWLARAALSWYHYHHDTWVVTNQRLIDSYRKHPFDLRVSTADLINVTDMQVHRRGILATTMDFGDIVCQTASSANNFTLTGIPDPRETQILVDRERDRERMRVRGI